MPGLKPGKGLMPAWILALGLRSGLRFGLKPGLKPNALGLGGQIVREQQKTRYRSVFVFYTIQVAAKRARPYPHGLRGGRFRCRRRETFPRTVAGENTGNIKL